MRSTLGGSAFFLGSDSYRSETRYALFRTKSNRNDSFSDRGFSENIQIDSGCIICRIYIHVFCIKQAVYAIRMQETILLSQRNYGWETNGLYMEDRPSVFSLQTVCFSFIRVVCISVLHCQPVKCRYSLVSFCSSLQRDGNMAFSLCIKSKVLK